MSEVDEDWALLRRTTPPITAEAEPAEDLAEDWRFLQGFNECGYMVTGTDWGYLAIWKVRLLGPAKPVLNLKSDVRYEKVELVWHQENASTEPTYKMKTTERVIRIFRTREDNIGSLQDACCRLGVLRDKARSDSLSHRTQLHNQVRLAQEEIIRATKRIADLDSFVPTSVVPGDILEAELREEDRVLSEIRSES